MKLFVLIISVLITFNVKAQTSESVIKFKDLFCSTENNITSCTDKKFNPFSGILKVRISNSSFNLNFKNGKPSGTVKSYYINGQLEAEGNFKDGYKDGFWKYYYSTGALKQLQKYDTGKLNNLKMFADNENYIEFSYENKELISTKTYQYGRLINEISFSPTYYTKEYYMNGKLKEMTTIENEKNITKIYDTEGRIIFEGDELSDFIGIGIENLSEEMKNKIQSNKGVYINFVSEESPGFYADILKGDILYSINNQVITNDIHYYKYLMTLNKGQSINITLLRNGEIISKNVIIK